MRSWDSPFHPGEAFLGVLLTTVCNDVPPVCETILSNVPVKHEEYDVRAIEASRVSSCDGCCARGPEDPSQEEAISRVEYMVRKYSFQLRSQQNGTISD